MKPSEVYRRAAELIASGKNDYACSAIFDASGRVGPMWEFKKYFMHKNEREGSSWFGDFTPENQRARELALYLMAEIAEDWE